MSVLQDCTDGKYQKALVSTTALEVGITNQLARAEKGVVHLMDGGSNITLENVSLKFLSIHHHN